MAQKKVTKENYMEMAKAIREKGTTLKIVKEMNSFQEKHYEKVFGYKPEKVWCISSNGKWWHCHRIQAVAQENKGGIFKKDSKETTKKKETTTGKAAAPKTEAPATTASVDPMAVIEAVKCLEAMGYSQKAIAAMLSR